jgi:hypothetical protein
LLPGSDIVLSDKSGPATWLTLLYLITQKCNFKNTLKKLMKVIFLKITELTMLGIEILITSDFSSIDMLLICCWGTLQFQSIKITVKTVCASNNLIYRSANYLTVGIIEFDINSSRSFILVEI